MTLLQAYLRAGGAPGDLLARGVKHRRHALHPNLVLFKYGIAAPFEDPLVRECRGVVLDEADGWAVVAHAFDKFFNHGEALASPIDWSTARVQEKLDGSLCVLYAYRGEWRVATTGTPDASGEIHATGLSFADYYWKTFAAEGGALPDARVSAPHADLSFAFELMGPANRIVVVHERPWLRLLAVRDRTTGLERPPEDYEGALGIPAVRSFPLSSLGEILASFSEISPMSQEGYVVVDAAFRRIKIKHPGYVALHHAKDGLGPRAFIEIARTGEEGEVASAFPELRPLIDDARARYAAFRAAVREAYGPIAGIEAQKDFAREALRTPYSAPLFQMRKGADLEAFLRGVPVDKLMAWMGVADDSAPATSAEDP